MKGYIICDGGLAGSSVKTLTLIHPSCYIVISIIITPLRSHISRHVDLCACVIFFLPNHVIDFEYVGKASNYFI